MRWVRFLLLLKTARPPQKFNWMYFIPCDILTEALDFMTHNPTTHRDRRKDLQLTFNQDHLTALYSSQLAAAAELEWVFDFIKMKSWFSKYFSMKFVLIEKEIKRKGMWNTCRIKCWVTVVLRPIRLWIISRYTKDFHYKTNAMPLAEMKSSTEKYRERRIERVPVSKLVFNWFIIGIITY